MSDRYPLCRCPEPAEYPASCPCLHLRLDGREMWLICRARLLDVPAAASRSRDEWIAAWLRAQKPTVPLTPSRVLHAAGSIAKTTLGIDRVSDDRHTDILAICESCPDNQYDAENDTCRACKCTMARKAYDQKEFCVRGYW